LNNLNLKQFLFFLVLAVGRCLAGEGAFFEIHEIKVKQDDENSFSAKQKALSRAARSAFRKLVKEKLDADPQIVEKVSNAQIQECIYDYSIENEKHSDSFYIAELSYRFSPKKVSLLLKNYGVILNVPDQGKPEEMTIVLRTKDFLQNAVKLRELIALVKSFSNEKIVFSIDKRNVEAFRALNIRYAQLQ
jgi:hypothetical protein